MRHVLFERFSVGTGDDRAMVVYRPTANNNNEDELFALLHGLYEAFGFGTSNGFSSYCSKKKVATVENDHLRAFLRVKGAARFINGTGIRALLTDRLCDEDLANAMADYEKALSGIGAGAVDRNSLGSDISPVPAVRPRHQVAAAPPAIDRPPPISVRADELALVVPKLRLPREESWWDNKDYVMGKKFALPEYDQSAALKTEIASYRTFWTQLESTGREGEALSGATLEKRVSRLLLYLGFLDLIKAVDDAKTLTVSACLSHQAVEKYCEWSSKLRQMLNSNVAENLSAMISVCKFLYRNRPEALNKYAGCEVILRYRTMRNRLMSKVNVMHKSSADLEDEGRWLSWNTFREAIAELQCEFDALPEEEPTTSSARLLMDLTMLRIYEASPCRSGEIRHLEYMPIEDIKEVKGKMTVSRWIGDNRKNVLTRRELSCWEMFIGNSKTTKHHGVDEVQFQDAVFPQLDRCLTLFLVEPNYRAVLLPEDKDGVVIHNNYAFLNSNGVPFKSSGFSTYLSRLLSRLTGSKATSNILRSSFVTNLFESNPSDATKSSAQSLLRHGNRMQSQTYDRRIPAHKKTEAQRFSSLTGKRDREDDNIIHRSIKSASVTWAQGMLCAVPYVELHGDPSFWFAKILNTNDVEAHLLELQLVPGSLNVYKANIRSTWTESISMLSAVDADYDSQTNLYTLRTLATDVLQLCNE